MFWQRFAWCFKTETRDTSRYAYNYLSAQLRLETERNFTNIAKATKMSAQNVHHFMSNSPWDARLVLWQVQTEIRFQPLFQTGSVLVLDESADQKASQNSVGAGRQYNGRLGKLDICQVGTFLAFAHPLSNTWTCIDGELYLQKDWFKDDMKEAREALGVPPDRPFATKIELGWQMIGRVKEQGVPFEAVACDDLYGRQDWFRAAMDKAGIVYMGDIARTTCVALTCPETDEALTVPVQGIALSQTTLWQRVRVRPTERGYLEDEFACVRVYTWYNDAPRCEWLVLRRHVDQSVSYSLCNAAADTPLERLAWLKCVRHFVERANQDAKSEAGWDDLRAQK